MNYGPVKTLFTGFTIVLLGALLTGCSGEPTGTELHKALQAEMDRANELTQMMLGAEESARSRVTIHAVDKRKCIRSEEADRAEYRCRVEMDITYPPAKRQKRKASIRMVKEDKGWMVVKSF